MSLINKGVAAILLLLLGPGLAFAGRPSGAAGRVEAPRPSRILSVAEICGSIRRALESNGAPETALPSAEQLRPAIPITVDVDDPGLQVLRMDADVVPGSVRVRLWTGKEPAIHPFDVMVFADASLLRWLDSRDASPRASVSFASDGKPGRERPLTQPIPKSPTLVFPGRTATLLLRAPGIEVRTPVVPLNSGVSGQWINVRNLATGQIISAQVVGPASLAAQF
jgi:hypothetical protein